MMGSVVDQLVNDSGGEDCGAMAGIDDDDDCRCPRVLSSAGAEDRSRVGSRSLGLL